MTREEFLNVALLQATEEGIGIHLAKFADICIKWGQQHPHWISVKDELPPDNEAFIAYWNHFVIVQQGRDERFGSNKHITHWMPLPQPPKEGGEE